MLLITLYIQERNVWQLKVEQNKLSFYVLGGKKNKLSYCKVVNERERQGTGAVKLSSKPP